MFQARGYGQGSHPLNTEGAVLLPQSFQGRIIMTNTVFGNNIIWPGLRASRDPGVWGQRPDVSSGLRPGDAGQEPRLPSKAVSGIIGGILIVLGKKLPISGLRAKQG